MRDHDDLTVAKQERALTRRRTQYINGTIEQLYVEYIPGEEGAGSYSLMMIPGARSPVKKCLEHLLALWT